jgi:hypothetical protein
MATLFLHHVSINNDLITLTCMKNMIVIRNYQFKISLFQSIQYSYFIQYW